MQVKYNYYSFYCYLLIFLIFIKEFKKMDFKIQTLKKQMKNEKNNELANKDFVSLKLLHHKFFFIRLMWKIEEKKI